MFSSPLVLRAAHTRRAWPGEETSATEARPGTSTKMSIAGSVLTVAQQVELVSGMLDRNLQTGRANGNSE